jgi:hypothetical protein
MRYSTKRKKAMFWTIGRCTCRGIYEVPSKIEEMAFDRERPVNIFQLEWIRRLKNKVTAEGCIFMRSIQRLCKEIQLVIKYRKITSLIKCARQRLGEISIVVWRGWESMIRSWYQEREMWNSRQPARKRAVEYGRRIIYFNGTAATGEQVEKTNWEQLVRAIVNCRVRELAKNATINFLYCL